MYVFCASTSRIIYGVQSLITSSAYIHSPRFQPTLQDYKTHFMLSNDVVQGLANGDVPFMKATLVIIFSSQIKKKWVGPPQSHI